MAISRVRRKYHREIFDPGLFLTLINSCFMNKKLIRVVCVKHLKFFAVGIFSLVFLLPACAGQPSNSLANQCSTGLERAYKALEAADAKGFGGSVAFVKASGLLTGAKVQQQFGKYPNCVNKVKRARYYIKQAEKGKDS